MYEPHNSFFLLQHDPGQATPFLEDDDDVETTICFGKRALCSKATIARSFNALVKIANPDKETKRLLALGVPFTLASVIGSFFDAVAVALVSNYLGVHALSAYVVTNLLVGLSDVFINGVSASLNTVCSHAIGAENYNLAGQYVQIAMTVYCALGVPIMGVWWFVMEDCLRLFGLNEEVVAIGGQYSKIVIFHYMFSGLFDSYTALLDISGYALPATLFDIIAGAAEAVVIWSLLAFQEGMTLKWVGVAHLVTGVTCFIFFTLIAVCRGWLDPFWDGLFKTFAIKVRSMNDTIFLIWISLEFPFFHTVLSPYYSNSFFAEHQCCQICITNSNPSLHRISIRIRRMGGTHILCCIPRSCGSSSVGNSRGHMGPL